MKAKILLLTIVTAGALYVAWVLRPTPHAIQSGPTATSQSTNQETAATTSPDGSLQPESNPTDVITSPAEDSAQTELNNWIAAESSSLDHSDQDAKLAEERIRKIAARLGPKEQKHLVKVASSEAPVNQRVLASYLLIQAGTKAIPDLKELIEQPLQKPGPYPAHSLEETLSLQERSIRIMAIDGLAAQAEKDPSALDALRAVADSSPSETIRNYAKRKIAELQ